MPKTKISEYSATNSSNTDIEGINIDEGCAPSGINNAIRELMVHLKEFQTGASGDAFTFAGGTLMSGTNTISGAAIISGNINSSGTNTFSGSNVMSFSGGSSASPSIYFASDTNTGIFSPAADTIAFTEGGVESMRINSSGNVGVGTTSPTGYRLNAVAAFASGVGGAYIEAGEFNQPVMVLNHTNGSVSANLFQVQKSGTGVLTLDSSGRLILGDTTADGRLKVVETAAGAGVTFYNSANNSAGQIGTTNESGTVNGLEINAYRGDGKIVFKTAGTERARIDSSGNVGIGTSSPSYRLDVSGFDATARINSSVAGGNSALRFLSGTGNNAAILFGDTDAADVGFIQYVHSDNSLRVNVNSAERARITSGGDFLVGKTADVLGNAGSFFDYRGSFTFTRDNSTVGYINRLTSDGTLLSFLQATTEEGTISVSGTTVSYNGGHLSRWAQMPGIKDDTLVKGTVMSNLDEMNVYIAPTTYWTEEDELPEGVNVGDVKVETHAVDNEQLNKVKVSDVEGDVNVAGVFVNWTHDDAHQVDEINMAMTGDMIIRIAQGVVVQKGDLLMSAGDGTAKPQGDDIVRSKTVAKVTSNHVTCTYADGSYCVPCVLMAC